MRVLAVVDGEIAGPEIFGEVVEERGHRLEIWNSTSTEMPTCEPGDYGAVLVFGGVMHADDEDRHPWLRAEHAFLRRLLELGVPTLGICLGAQLLAKAANGKVGPAAEPEIGWHDESPRLGARPQCAGRVWRPR